jgi:hypothetical protein
MLKARSSWNKHFYFIGFVYSPNSPVVRNTTYSWNPDRPGLRIPILLNSSDSDEEAIPPK